MFIDFLVDSFERNFDKEAIVWRDRGHSYSWLARRIRHFLDKLKAEGIGPGSVAALEVDFSPNSAALFLALVEKACVLVPLTSAMDQQKPDLEALAQAEASLALSDDDSLTIRRTSSRATHGLYRELRKLGHPGLVLFTSGSTGKSKAVVHDMMRLLSRYRSPGRGHRTISFLLFDHIGGVNTMLYTLASGGCLVTVRGRSPDDVLGAVDRHRADLLPTSPTFLNMVLLSEAYRRHDLSSLKLISYGTEPMPQSTLKRIHELLPEVRLLQTYGLSEIGILRSRSRASDSLWVQLGGEGYQTRVVGGTLQIKAESAVLGYLNAPNPFTADGWLNTGDSVEVDGDFVRILGRGTEIINVGGQKVHPAEVESVLHEIDGVAEVAVYGEKNPMVGNIVCAEISPLGDEDKDELVRRIKDHCRRRLPRHKVPVRVTLNEALLHTDRFKKKRPVSGR